MGPQLSRLTVPDEYRLEHPITAHQTEVVNPDLGRIGILDGSIEEYENAHNGQGS